MLRPSSRACSRLHPNRSTAARTACLLTKTTSAPRRRDYYSRVYGTIVFSAPNDCTFPSARAVNDAKAHFEKLADDSGEVVFAAFGELNPEYGITAAMLKSDALKVHGELALVMDVSETNLLAHRTNSDEGDEGDDNPDGRSGSDNDSDDAGGNGGTGGNSSSDDDSDGAGGARKLGIETDTSGASGASALHRTARGTSRARFSKLIA